RRPGTGCWRCRRCRPREPLCALADMAAPHYVRSQLKVVVIATARLPGVLSADAGVSGSGGVRRCRLPRPLRPCSEPGVDAVAPTSRRGLRPGRRRCPDRGRLRRPLNPANAAPAADGERILLADFGIGLDTEMRAPI